MQYSTIQQHQPLRVPQSFDKQGRALIVQLDEIFDDIYRRFGRLKTTDLGKELQDLVLIKGENGAYTSVTYALGQIQTDIQDELGNYYTKTETAEEIATKMTNALGNYYNKSETAEEISTRMSNALGNYYNKTETATEITTRMTTALGDYSKISDTASAISAAVADCYGKVSNITINSSGITIDGSKAVEIKSGSRIRIMSGGAIYINASNDSDTLFTMSSYGIEVESGGNIVLKSGSGFKVRYGSTFQVTNSGGNAAIEMSDAGIDIKGGAYVKLQSGNSIVQIDPTQINMNTSGLVSILGHGNSIIKLIGDQTIFQADSSGVVQAYKVAADQIDAATLNVTNLNVAGNLIAELGLPSFVINSNRPSGHNIIWLEPNSSVPTPFSETKNVNDTTRNGWSQVGSTYSWTQTVSLASVIAAKGTNKLKISGNLYKNGNTSNQEGTLYATVNLANGSTIDMGLVGTFPRLQSLLWNYGFSKEIDITAISAETNISSITFKYATSVNDPTAYTSTTNTVKLTASGTRGTAGSSDECTVHYIA